MPSPTFSLIVNSLTGTQPVNFRLNESRMRFIFGAEASSVTTGAATAFVGVHSPSSGSSCSKDIPNVCAYVNTIKQMGERLSNGDFKIKKGKPLTEPADQGGPFQLFRKHA